MNRFLAPMILPFLAVGCQNAKPKEAKLAPVAVALAKAEARKIPDRLLLTGELKGQEDAWIAADTTGKVEAVLVERGSMVKKGDPMVRLEVATYALDLKQAEAGWSAAKAQYQQLKADVDRFRTLLERSTITRTDFDRVQTQFLVAEANFEAASARRDQVKKRMEDSIIKAPFAGSVVERIVQVGEYIRPDSKVLRLVSTGPLRLTVNVPESAISRIHAKQTLDFQVAAFGAERFPGIVKFLPAGLREQSRDFIVEADVRNADGRLRAGMFASAQLTVGEVPGVVIPESCLRREGNNVKVYVKKDGQLQERLVELGEIRNGSAEIRKGLEAGESVVKTLSPDIKDGVPTQN